MAGEGSLRWTPLELIRVSTEYLADRGVPSPRLDAELLLAHVLQTDRLHLYLEHERPLVSGELDRYRQLIRRRGNREPLQLLVGSVQLHELEFEVEAGVFIPRPETEVLIEAADELPFPPNGHIVEVGVGSGCVGISLLCRRPEATLVGWDLLPAAVELSRRNARRHGVEGRAQFFVGDAFAAELTSLWQDCDLVVSNPPYVPLKARDELQPEVLQHDPPQALFSGEDGLETIRVLCAHAGRFLAKGGWLVFEHGDGQEERIARELAKGPWEGVVCRRDLAGRSRVTLARRRESSS